MTTQEVPDQKFIDQVSVLVLRGVLTKDAAISMIDARRQERQERELINEAATRLIEGMGVMMRRRPE